ncbi:hypothetical protein [Streptomyces violascens]|uniref:hypothetical protein n=1 Tax=Streptomyces violascens TaxID=67381 RepID=UPI0036CC5926
MRVLAASHSDEMEGLYTGNASTGVTTSEVIHMNPRSRVFAAVTLAAPLILAGPVATAQADPPPVAVPVAANQMVSVENPEILQNIYDIGKYIEAPVGVLG